MKRPTFFLSSTIYDFRDMRSAIKAYLEDRGCRVLASEFNDFTKPLDQHSYQACLSTIEQADFFLLMVGSRVGGWYDADLRISITQQEYRTAYSLAQEGRIRLLSFVRDDIWNHRQSTKDLNKHLSSLSELDDSIRRKISNHQSSFASDVDFIVGFIDEISRNKETATAAANSSKMPIGNWVHTFKGFSDIRDAIAPLVLKGMNVEEAAGRKALQNQLLFLLRDIAVVNNDRAVVPQKYIRDLAHRINLHTDSTGKLVVIKKEDWDSLTFVSILVSRCDVEVSSLAAALSSDLLLEYDPREGVYQQTEAYNTLTELIGELRKFERALSRNDLSKLLLHGTKKRTDGSVSLPSAEVAGQLHILFRWSNVSMLAVSLARVLEGHPMPKVDLMPLSPYLDQQEALLAERVSWEQARSLAGLDT